MQPFPPHEELGFLIGCELAVVTLGPYQVDFTFDEGPLLVVEHGLQYLDPAGRTHTHDPQRRLAPDSVAFHALIGKRTTDLRIEPYRLSLIFGDSGVLVVLSQEGPYESGHIRYDPKGPAGPLVLIVF